MRIGEITNSSEYRMDEQKQNLPIFGIKLWLSRLKKNSKFGVKFTGDYRSIAIIPILFRDHRQKSKKPNFSSFFRLLTVIPK